MLTDTAYLKTENSSALSYKVFSIQYFISDILDVDEEMAEHLSRGFVVRESNAILYIPMKCDYYCVSPHHHP